MTVRSMTLRAGQGATAILIWAALLKAGLVTGALVAIGIRYLVPA
jgi:hypothetical protein